MRGGGWRWCEMAMVDGMTLPHCAKGTAVCGVARLRVRLRPDLAAGTVLGFLGLGEPVRVWAVEDGWAIVDSLAQDLCGWAFAEYLQVQGELRA